MKNFNELLDYTNILMKENGFKKLKPTDDVNERVGFEKLTNMFQTMMDEITQYDSEILNKCGEKNIAMAILLACGVNRDDAYRTACEF